jgi:hypothetical protein
MARCVSDGGVRRGDRVAGGEEEEEGELVGKRGEGRKRGVLLSRML